MRSVTGAKLPELKGAVDRALPPEALAATESVCDELEAAAKEMADEEPN